MKSRRKQILIGTAGIVVLGGIAAAVVGFNTAGEPTPPKNAPSAATETATQGELIDRVKVKGTLAYAGSHELGTTLAGTVTGVPTIGSVIGRGGELFRIDDRPVMMLLGELPVWRSFEYGMSAGRDVRQLEQNLAELGYFGYEPDEVFDGNTQSAIGSWEKALGLRWTGALEQGSVVFNPSDVRVAAVKSTIGSPAGPSILAVSGTAKQVSAFVDPALRDVVAVGAAVSVSLPDGTSTAGTVASVDTPVEREDQSGGKSVKLPVTMTLDDPAAAEAYTDVDVTVTVTRVLSEDALLVPVTALLAQSGGGFAVEVATSTGTKRVTVELGTFADGMVAVTGGKLKTGDRVVVAE